MTQEEKAKAYDEALERAKQFSEHPLLEDSANIVEYIFPELAESEDERIRKEILNVFKQLGKDTTLCGRNYDYTKWIAWLEKQGETYTKKDVDDAYVEGIAFAKRELEKQGEKKETLCDKCRKEQPSHSCQDITANGRCYIECINTSNYEKSE